MKHDSEEKKAAKKESYRKTARIERVKDIDRLGLTPEEREKVFDELALKYNRWIDSIRKELKALREEKGEME